MSMINERAPPSSPRADDGIMGAFRAGVKAAADTYAKHGMQLRTGIGLPGIDAAPYYQNAASTNEMQARAAEKIQADTQAPTPSDHLGSRLQRFAELAERAHFSAGLSEKIEITLFGSPPPTPPSTASGAARTNDPPLAERFGDVARNLEAALDRVDTALARIAKHIE